VVLLGLGLVTASLCLRLPQDAGPPTVAVNISTNFEGDSPVIVTLTQHGKGPVNLMSYIVEEGAEQGWHGGLGESGMRFDSRSGRHVRV